MAGEIDRREFLKLAAMATAATTVPSFVLSACGTNAASGGGPGTYKGVAPFVDLLHGQVVRSNFVTLNREYYLQWHQGAQHAVEALGGVYKYATDDQNAAAQIQHFESQVQAGEKIFFNAAPDPSTLAPISKAAADHQAWFTHFFEIPEWGSPFDPRINPSQYFVTFFSPDLRGIGEAEITELASAMGGSGNIIHITGFPGSTPDLLLSAGIKSGLDKLPNITVLGSQPGNWLEADSRTAMAAMIKRFGNQIQGVIGQNEDCAIGAAQALSEAGMSGIPVVTNGGTKLGVSYIQQGKMHATFALHPAWNAGLAAVQAIDAALGWKPSVPERMLLCSGSFVRKDNADAYLNYINGPDPFDWSKMSRIAHPNDWDPQGPVRTLRLKEFWGDVPQPPGFTYPSEIAAAESAGLYDQVDANYKSHYQKKIFGDK